MTLKHIQGNWWGLMAYWRVPEHFFNFAGIPLDIFIIHLSVCQIHCKTEAFMTLNFCKLLRMVIFTVRNVHKLQSCMNYFAAGHFQYFDPLMKFVNISCMQTILGSVAYTSQSCQPCAIKKRNDDDKKREFQAKKGIHYNKNYNHARHMSNTEMSIPHADISILGDIVYLHGGSFLSLCIWYHQRLKKIYIKAFHFFFLFLLLFVNLYSS